MNVARAICSALVFGVALAVITPAAGANKQSNLPFLISSNINSDSTAARAVRRWVKEWPADATPRIQALHGSPAARTQNGIVLVPLVEWSRKLPAFNILRLPFFYSGIPDVHRAIDGQTGLQLTRISKTAGWKLLAIWDDGMTVFSGNQDYSRLLNLKGMEFATWEPDPLQMTELRALDVWLRVIAKNGVQRNAQQCIVDSRSTTPAQMWREHLQRVHLDITLTHDRYEGFVLAIPNTLWNTLTGRQRASLTGHLVDITKWERVQAAKEQQHALASLHKAGITLHPLAATQRKLFTSRMPPWPQFLKQLDTQMVNKLIATARTTTAAGRRSGSRENALAEPLPTAQTTE